MKKLLSIILSICMLMSITAGIDLTTFAADNGFSFTVSNGEATITGYSPVNSTLVIPSTVGGANYKVTKIGEKAFYRDGKSYTSVIIPDSVLSIGDYAFGLCKELESVTMSKNVTYIGNYAFEGCVSLTNIAIPDSVKYIGKEAFYNCEILKGITIPNGVTFVGDYAFYGCYGLTNIKIPKSMTSISNGTFCDCKNLKSVTMSDSITSIGRYAFSSCQSLTEIIIPKNVTYIGDTAFYRCKSLTSINIPKGVTHIYSDTFNSTGLTDVYYSGSKSEWYKIVISEYNEELLNANIYFNACINKKDHNYKTTTTKATYAKAGKTETKCTVCGKVTSTKTIAKLTVPKITLSSVKSKKSKQMTVAWKKNTKVTGYQIQYATNSKFTKNKKTITISKNSTTSKTITKLKGKTKYYVRVRGYKTENGKKYYSAWSTVKAVTVKK